jgi:hypothetical protein
MTLAFPKPEKRPPRPRKALRRSWIKRKRPRRLSKAGADLAYLAKVRELPCSAILEHFRQFFCDGRIHAHHAIHRSQGGDDHDAIPLCQKHHMDWHECTGPFRGLSKLERFAWSVNAISQTRKELGRDE